MSRWRRTLATMTHSVSTPASGAVTRLLSNLGHVLADRDEVLRAVIATFLARGHLLLEDVPGVGKTTLAKALAFTIGGTAGRVQFTPDLLPSDLTGVSVYRSETGEFEFHPGPLFATVVIGDEINRASPKTQSALLECMQERQVTVDGVSHPLPDPFIVIATQNPVEMEGTYPLPEAQRDRFMARVSLGYPSPRAELDLLGSGGFADPLARLAEPLTTEQVRTARQAVQEVFVAPTVAEYILELIRATRSIDVIELGASPRAGLQLLAMAKARAVIDERDFVVPDDVQEVAGPVLAHRLALRRGASQSAATVIADILAQVPAPAPR